MSFAPIQRQSAAAQIADSISSAVFAGRYVAGDPLPSERDLAKDFGVNRSTVREGLHRLSALGIVDIRHGEAARIRDYLATTGLKLLPQLLMPGGVADVEMLRDLLDVRSMVLGWTARRAARSAPKPNIRRLQEIIDALVVADGADRRGALDYDFFQEMVRLTGNRVLSLLGSALRDAFETHEEVFAPMFEGESFDVSHHRRATKSIGAGNPVAAGKAMESYADASTQALFCGARDAGASPSRTATRTRAAGSKR
jgi:GntR family transcriptional regulator, transcriptional repressor for pyruvate dehydrogenase complex